jgi:hypothetical protein
MPRLGISSHPRSPRRYDPAYTDGFESASLCEQEDRLRAHSLRKQAVVDAKRTMELLDLADRIDPDNTDDPTTPASRRFMRAKRRRIIGALWRLHDEA